MEGGWRERGEKYSKRVTKERERRALGRISEMVKEKTGGRGWFAGIGGTRRSGKRRIEREESIEERERTDAEGDVDQHADDVPDHLVQGAVQLDAEGEDLVGGGRGGGGHADGEHGAARGFAERLEAGVVHLGRDGAARRGDGVRERGKVVTAQEPVR